MTEFIGQRFQLFGDTTRTYRLGAALQTCVIMTMIRLAIRTVSYVSSHSTM